MNQRTIWDSIEETQSIFIEKDVFTIEYVPETIKYRDKQIEMMIYNLKDRLSHNKKPYHMILNGAYSTGKTMTINYVFSEVARKFPKVKPVHINCRNNRSQYEIYLRIYEKLFNMKKNVRGFSTFTILNKIIKEIVKKDFKLLVALDDISSVKTDRDLNNVLYNLLRASETDMKAKISVFSVTNKKRLCFLDGSVSSVFNGIEVDFPNYSYDEMHNILSERCRLGLYDGAISDEIIDDVTRYCYDHGDLRKGLHEIYKAGLNAEYEGSHKILKNHFN
jgi:archaeal cell division control protein 6